jgi:hypothetical protein
MQSKEHVFGGMTSIPRDRPSRRDGTGPNIELIQDYINWEILCQLCGVSVFSSKISKNILIIIRLDFNRTNYFPSGKGSFPPSNLVRGRLWRYRSSGLSGGAWNVLRVFPDETN